MKILYTLLWNCFGTSNKNLRKSIGSMTVQFWVYLTDRNYAFLYVARVCILFLEKRLLRRAILSKSSATSKNVKLFSRIAWIILKSQVRLRWYRDLQTPVRVRVFPIEKVRNRVKRVILAGKRRHLCNEFLSENGAVAKRNPRMVGDLVFWNHERA